MLRKYIPWQLLQQRWHKYREKMLDLFLVKQMLPLLHAPICIYNSRGQLLKALEDVDYKMLIGPGDFQKIDWKYPASSRSFGMNQGGRLSGTDAGQGNRKRFSPIPYIHVEESGVAFGAVRLASEEILGLGKLRLYDFTNEEAYQYPYCDKREFGAVLCILWKMISGNEISINELWAENVDIGISLEVHATKDIFELQEEGRRHKPYALILQEQDSIRAGDLDGLRKALDETYSGQMGILANDIVRQYKNNAICVIAGAARSAIEGGLNPEQALSMSDTFIRNIEETQTEPQKIEKAAREAQFEFARMVHGLREKKNGNPLVDQARDYVFCHIHEPLKVKDIADAIGVTPNYLSEQFSQSMGITLKQYIIDEKIESSERLLKYTDYSLQEISSYCAFSSQSRFSEYFERKNGVTPAKYRKRCRNQKVNKK